jgi:DUF1009 family protein
MLNPSIADEKIDDATIKKCITYCKKFNHDELYVVNLFPQIQKKPNFNKLKNCQTNKLVIEKTLKKIPSKWRHFFCEPLQCSPLLTYLT